MNQLLTVTIDQHDWNETKQQKVQKTSELRGKVSRSFDAEPNLPRRSQLLLLSGHYRPVNGTFSRDRIRPQNRN